MAKRTIKVTNALTGEVREVAIADDDPAPAKAQAGKRKGDDDGANND